MRYRFILFILLSSVNTFARNITPDPKDNSNKIIHIKKMDDKLKLDGVLDENVWNNCTKYTDFWMKFPTNESVADPITEIKLTYDDKFLYFGVKVYEKQDRLLVQSLKRDQGLRTADGIGIVIDPVNLKTNGFYFAVTPFNSQTEGLIGNTQDDVSFTWDNTWYSETKKYDDYWTAEIAIPFSILRYDQTKKVWGINFIRSARIENEFHTWTNIPLQFRGTDLGYLGQMVWDANPPDGGSTVSLNPYVLGAVAADPENGEKTNLTGNAGMDAKIALSSSINLDLTVNPDFSNTDVDVQVTNLTRFSLFFPERRVFFLENDDLFSNFGIPPIRPFYSRRIGSKDDTNVPILFGARLTGNVNKNLRVGAMNIQTGRKDTSAADNFTTVTFNQQVLDRSVIKGYFTNRSSFQNDTEKANDPLGAYGRNAGLEMIYTNKEGTVMGWANTHLSFKPTLSGNNQFLNGGAGYFGQNLTCFIDLVNTGKNYYADAGFVNRIENYDAARDTSIRVGFTFGYNETNYTFYPKSGPFNKLSFGVNNFLSYDDKNDFNERNNYFVSSFSFRNTSSISASYNSNSVNLLYPFSFVDDDEDVLPLPAQVYHFDNVVVSGTTDTRKNFVLEAGTTLGKLYSAKYQQFYGSVTIRKQPYYSCALRVEYNNLAFPKEYGSTKYLLIAPRIEINFTNNLFWTSFLQFNSQANNFNINSRLQWRYKPMSDMFLVYSDNYFTDPLFQNKNRAFVFKVNYWINV
jgi:hypothetical protein